MAKVKQSKLELISHLRENLNFLRASSAAFDSGHHGEAKRLAVTVRLLLHDTMNSKSLLGQLGWKKSMGFYDTAIDYRERNPLGHHGLVGLRIGDGKGVYFAPLSDDSPERPYKYVFFSDWWNKTVIVDLKKNKFNRRELVLALANKDGGAHVDPHLDESYAELTRNNSLGWSYSDGQISRPFESVELHSARQIAFEIIKSIERQFSKRKID